MSKLNSFNSIAWCYDIFATVIFFGRIFRSQIHFLSRIPPKSNVLVLGGGSGRILQALFLVNPCVKVWYVDASSAMIRKSTRRVSPNHKVVFIHGTEADIPLNISFDAVITPFFLDLFEEPYLSGLVSKLLKISSSNSLWLVSDFVSDVRWHRHFLSLMYRFFNIVCGVTPRQLPAWDKILENHGLHLEERRSYYAGFISANIYCVTTRI